MARTLKQNTENLQKSNSVVGKEEIVVKENTTTVEEMMKQMQDQIAKLIAEKEATNTNNPTIVYSTNVVDKKNDVNREIKVVHLLDNIDGLTTHLKVDDHVSYDFRKFGDYRYLRRDEFMALYYARREAFENNIVGLTSEDEDIIEKLGLTNSDTLPINSGLLRDFPYMNEEKMTDFYNQLSSIHKELVIRKWYAGFEEGKDLVFKDMRKIRFLNDLTNGQMDRLIRQIKLSEELEKKNNK